MSTIDKFIKRSKVHHAIEGDEEYSHQLYLCQQEHCEHEVQEPGLCDACTEELARVMWLQETEQKIVQLAREYGWSVERKSGGFNTPSRYIELERSDEEGDEWQSIMVRVSDHSSAYCSEDISICMSPGGDDHTIYDLRKILASDFEAD